MTDLKPCPNPGCNRSQLMLVLKNPSDDYYSSCGFCGMSGPWAESPEEAIKLHNALPRYQSPWRPIEELIENNDQSIKLLWSPELGAQVGIVAGTAVFYLDWVYPKYSDLNPHGDFSPEYPTHFMEIPEGPVNMDATDIK